MSNILAIFIGGGFGCLARYGISILLRMYSFNFPFATIIVNIAGSLILGFIAALFWKQMPLHTTLKLAITVGFCGGLTTFSTFSWETFEMIKNGELLLAFFYILISVIACTLAIALGVFISKYV